VLSLLLAIPICIYMIKKIKTAREQHLQEITT